MKKEIKITVSGVVNSGKSRIIYLIKKLLREDGFNVEFKGCLDFHTETDLDKIAGKNFNEIIKKIKADADITIESQQLNKPWFIPKDDTTQNSINFLKFVAEKCNHVQSNMVSYKDTYYVTYGQPFDDVKSTEELYKLYLKSV